MSEKTFKALVVHEVADGDFRREVATRRVADLPAGEVLVRVSYSSLNYKDALSATGHKGVTRSYPHTPGIDAAGVVEESLSQDFSPGDKVIVTGYDLGVNTPGGFGQYIRVPAAWLLACPEGLSLRESMGYGTAGLTAALGLLRLQGHGVSPEEGEILVTGATGGVGSLAVAVLAKLGYHVVAATGKLEAAGMLKALGAEQVVHRDDVTDRTDTPLLKSRWAGVIDTVGGEILSTAIRSTHYGGTVTCCGLVASPDLPISVYPFILRGINLLGIESVKCPMVIRRQIWQKLSREWKVEGLSRIVVERPLADLEPEVHRILRGEQRGRVVVDMS